MNTSLLEPCAKKVTFDAEIMWVELVDGRELGIPLSYFPRLFNASPTQRKKYSMSGGGRGLHWENLNEDISVPALLQGKVDRTLGNEKSTRAA